ncbi:MAG: hypothetical protein KGI25_03015 [Thaumarchaeota archaeon]|nr:hypothetical protein [Nitrososphaerota archaeon]
MSNKFEFLGRVMFHYAKKFEDMKSDEEIKTNNFIKKDLDDNAEKATELARQLLQIQTNNTITDNNAFIKSAVKVYLNDLKNSKDALIEKLKENQMSDYYLNNLNDEIKQAEGWLE